MRIFLNAFPLNKLKKNEKIISQILHSLNGSETFFFFAIKLSLSKFSFLSLYFSKVNLPRSLPSEFREFDVVLMGDLSKLMTIASRSLLFLPVDFPVVDKTEWEGSG